MAKKELSLDREVKDGNKVPCEVYSRICGYLQPTITWNKGKRKEFADRKYFDIRGYNAD